MVDPASAPRPVPVILDPATAEFIASGISINAAATRPDAVPSMARAIGCRVAADARIVTLLFAGTPAAALLDDIRRSGALAVVFSQPSTHRTLQLKGDDARIVPVAAADRALCQRYIEIFVDGLTQLGYPGEVLRALLDHDPDDLVAVQFTPASAFSQTPGPGAGEPLPPASPVGA